MRGPPRALSAINFQPQPAAVSSMRPIRMKAIYVAICHIIEAGGWAVVRFHFRLLGNGDRQIFVTVGRDQQIVFDPNAPDIEQFVHARPVDRVAILLAASLIR